MLSDILRAPSKAGETGKPLSKSEEGGLAAEPRAEPEHCQTPDSARRIRPKYSREGKSQSLILLSGEDEDALGLRHDKVSTVAVTEPPPPTLLFGSPRGCCSHPRVLVVGSAGNRRGTWGHRSDGWGTSPLGCGHASISWGQGWGWGPECPAGRQVGGCCGGCRAPGRAVSVLQKRHLEKSEGELPGSFEQRMQVMLHRIGVTKGPAAEGKKQQVGSGSTFGMDPAPKGWVEVVVHGMGVPWPGLAAPSSVPPLPVASVLSPNPLQGDRYMGSYVPSVRPSFPGMHPSPAATPEPGSTLPSATRCP